MSSDQLGDAPIEKRFTRLMKSVARELDTRFNPDTAGVGRTVGFVLLVFPYRSEDGRCNYISNGADRGDVLRLLEEQAQRFREQGL
jgi:hypothetical protein